MTTKYVLHGGAAQHDHSKNDFFFEEVLKDTFDIVKILLVEFAGRKAREKLNLQIDSNHFTKVKGNKILEFEKATLKNFLSQIKNNDVIYFGGGTTIKLLKSTNKYKDLGTSFENKIIAGESAGMNFLAKYCYSKSGGGVIKCLGVLPIKTYPHWDGIKNKELENTEPKLKTVYLKEYQFITIKT